MIRFLPDVHQGALHDRRGKRRGGTAENADHGLTRRYGTGTEGKAAEANAAWTAGFRRTKPARNILRQNLSRTPETGRERKQLSGQNTGTRKVPRGDRQTARGAETPRGVRPRPTARAGQPAPPRLPEHSENTGSAAVQVTRERPRETMPGEARWIPGRLFPGPRGG